MVCVDVGKCEQSNPNSATNNMFSLLDFFSGCRSPIDGARFDENFRSLTCWNSSTLVDRSGARWFCFACDCTPQEWPSGF